MRTNQELLSESSDYRGHLTSVVLIRVCASQDCFIKGFDGMSRMTWARSHLFERPSKVKAERLGQPRMLPQFVAVHHHMHFWYMISNLFLVVFLSKPS